MSPKPRPPRSIQDQLPCSRHPMRVELRKTLRWKHVVIPQFYEAYRCAGACRFPLGTNVSFLFSVGRKYASALLWALDLNILGIN